MSNELNLTNISSFVDMYFDDIHIGEKTRASILQQLTFYKDVVGQLSLEDYNTIIAELNKCMPE